MKTNSNLLGIIKDKKNKKSKYQPRWVYKVSLSKGKPTHKKSFNLMIFKILTKV
jgi:hypothetical protein